MQDLSFNRGVKEYTMNGTSFWFNPSDQNFFYRFTQVQNNIFALQDEYEERAKEFGGKADLKELPVKSAKDGGSRIDVDSLSDDQLDAAMDTAESFSRIVYDLDQRVKAELRAAFHENNDFDAIFGGANVLAKDEDGNIILENFFNAIYPLIEDAAKANSKEVNKYVGNRAMRRARNRPNAVLSGGSGN